MAVAIICLLSYTDAASEMQLVPEPIFTVATDGIGITTIANNNSGRIFLGGRNGSLYEIYYQVKFDYARYKCANNYGNHT